MRNQTGDGEATLRSAAAGSCCLPQAEEIQGNGDVIEAGSQGLPGGSWDLRERGYQEGSLHDRGVQSLL